ncbi:MAG: hypothetical protein Q9191_006888 [Dirinaria sp. TL-2023a]
MPKAKPITTLSAMVDSDMDDELDNAGSAAFTAPDSNQENNTAPAKKGRPRTKAAGARFSKAKAPARRASGGAGVGKKKAVPRKKGVGKREPLKEQTNVQHGSDTEEVDEFGAHATEDVEPTEDVSMDEQPAKKQPAKRKPAAKGKRQAEKEPELQSKPSEKDGEFEYTPTVARQSKSNAKPAVAAQKAAVGRPQRAKEIPETQEEPMDIAPSSLPMDEDVIPQSVYRQTSNFGAGSKPRQPAVTRRRAGSASDTERTTSDPALRRKLGDVTKKFENLEMKYNNLKETGIEEAKANFEKLKASSEAKTKAANDLIASLKKDVAAQKALAQESRLLSKQIETKDNDLVNANAKIDLLNASLTEAQNENKALQAKLANVRSAPPVVESIQGSKAPGSAVKGKGQVRTVMVGSAEAAQAAQIAQLKEDLYSDLTGLLLRGVEKGEEENVYDCIQTGRNGTMTPLTDSSAALHFKIAISNDADTAYDDAEVTYTPLLDTNRDRDILQLMPDYLTEEITFSRNHAAHFYCKVAETLMKKQQRAMSEEA